MCNLRTLNHFDIKSHDQGEDVTHEFHRSWGNPNVGYNFKPCQEVEQKEESNFFHVKLSQ